MPICSSSVCGIGGIVGGGRPDVHVLTCMCHSMEHRGPDGHGVWADEDAGLAFTRLAVIDLDPRSDQPLGFGHLQLVFNGEIYNYVELRDELRSAGHRFHTEGDAEVLLHAWAQWGERALDRVNGMFALAVWDSTEKRLTLARDPFGEKPLYYVICGERITFASDITAMLCDESVDTAPRRSAVEDYLVNGSDPGLGESFFSRISTLPASHLLRWHAGSIELERYWTPRSVPVPARYEDAVGTLRELLRDSVRLRLRSDVPVGTSLSGGIDSSAIVTLASELASENARHAFTARFPGFHRDEWPYAQEVARAANVIEHHCVEPTAEQLIDDIEQLVSLHQEPVGSASIYAQWRVMQAAKQAGVVVLLDGQGGDELFAGYEGMAGYAARSAGARGLLRGIATRGVRGELLRSLAVERLPRSVARAYRLHVWSPYAGREALAVVARREPEYLPWMLHSDPLRGELLRQCFLSSLPALLRYADRSSMAHSREVRLPLLDRRIAEFALALPASFVSERGVSKRVLRDAVRGLVPERVLARRDKIGFEPPQASWLEAPVARRRIAETMLDPRARARDIYDTSAIESDVRLGRWRDHRAIWRAFNLELWLSQLQTMRSHPPARQSPTVVS
jgi:asparagine synthase (glutamine-hydrolysing)